MSRKARRNTSEVIYIATLLNPVDHKPYAVTWSPTQQRCYIVYPPSAKPHTGKIVGEGYFEDDPDHEYGWSAKATGCPRSHTPSGVTTIGAGLGLMLYSGLALTAAYAHGIGETRAGKLKLPTMTSNTCISSSHHGRSASATKWWEAQARRGFVEIEISDEEVEDECEDDEYEIDVDADTIGIDEGSVKKRAARTHSVDSIQDWSVSGTATVRYTFCTEGNTEENEAHILRADKVMESGFVLDVNEDVDGTVSLPPSEILGEIDLSEVKDLGFFAMIEDAYITAGVSAEGYRKLMMKKLPFWTSREEIAKGKVQGAYHEYARNPKTHSKTWRTFYADVLAAEAIIAAS